SLRDFVEEGDLRLAGIARDRKPDQEGDQHRVGDQESRLQRRPAQDLQILEQEPAHQWPRWWRKATKAGSKSVLGASGVSSRTAPRSSSADPSKRLSPSARTSSRCP